MGRNIKESYTGRPTYSDPTSNEAFRNIRTGANGAKTPSEITSLQRELRQISAMRRQGVISRSEEGRRSAQIRRRINQLTNGEPAVTTQKTNPKGGDRKMTEAFRPIDLRETVVEVDPNRAFEPSGAVRRNFRPEESDRSTGAKVDVLSTGERIQRVKNGDKETVRIPVFETDERGFQRNVGKPGDGFGTTRIPY